MFGRRSRRSGDAACPHPDGDEQPDAQIIPFPGRAEPQAAEPPSVELAQLAARFGLAPWDVRTDDAPPSLAAAIAAAGPLWGAPRAGEVQPGVTAIFGGHPPASVVGVRLWPVPVSTESGPALVLADIRHRVHVVVDAVRLPNGAAPQPGWAAAATVSYGARLPGSSELWLHWAPELADHAPHEWTTGCDVHAHLARPNAHGQWVTAIPQHDAWMMSKSWVSPELVVPSIADVRWVVLSASARPLKQRELKIRSRWDVVSFAAFGTAVAAGYDEHAPLPTSVARLLRLLLPDRTAAAVGRHRREEPDTRGDERA